MKRWIKLICLAVAVWISPSSSTAAEPSRPNIIIVMVDDMGYAGLSCFGNPYFQTPELDRLAEEGMRLTDFHSSGTVCSPTRTGLLTGRYQQRAGIEAVIHPVTDHPEHRKGLQPTETTFAEVLSEAGYVTGLIGKWQNSSVFHPQNHGFDEFIGYHSGNIDFVSHVGDHNLHDWWHGRQELVEAGYSTHLINHYTLDFVERHANKDQPFCLYVAHEAIHNPVQVPGDPVRRTTEVWDRWKWQEVSHEERIEKYRGMTIPIDQGIGELRQKLIDLKIHRKTFVLFFSDNGPSRDFPSGSESLRGWKGEVYEGGHKVPAIAWWPSRVRPRSESNQPLISLDVMPTVLSLAGISTEALDLDGVDFSNIFRAEHKLPPRPLFWASLSNNGQRAEAMRKGPWKLVVKHPKAAPGTFENPRLELFRLDLDPGEQQNLAESNPHLAKRMHKELQAWYAEATEHATHQPGGWSTHFGSVQRKTPP